MARFEHEVQLPALKEIIAQTEDGQTNHPNDKQTDMRIHRKVTRYQIVPVLIRYEMCMSNPFCLKQKLLISIAIIPSI